MKKFVFIILTGLVSFPVDAMPVTVNISATVTANELGGEFAIGENASLVYQFNLDTPDTWTINNSNGGAEEVGYYFGSIFSASLQIGVYEVTTVGLGNIYTLDNWRGSDLYAVEIADSPFITTRPHAIIQGAMVAGRDPFAISLELRDLNGAAFSSDALPVEMPILNLFEVNSLELAFAERLEEGRAFGTARVTMVINAITFTPEPAALPEPASLAILGLGLAGLGFIRCKIKGT